MFNIKPQKDVFFELFINAAKNANDATIELDNLLQNYDNHNEIIEKISQLESNGDSIKFQIEENLINTFITPFDREDIYMIAKKIDRYVNLIQSTAFEFNMLHIKETTPSSKLISEQLVNATELLVVLMENLKDRKNKKVVKDCIIKINKTESEVDDIYRNAITELFDQPTDILNVIKWREIYKLLENSCDACEEIANVIEGVVTKDE